MPDQPTDTPVLDLLARMTGASAEASSFDDQTMMLVRIAALIAVDAPPASYVFNLGVASEAGLDVQDLRDTLTAVAPIVGTARIVAATGNIARGLGVALEVADEYVASDTRR